MSCSPKSLRQSQVFQSFESLLQFPVSAHKLHPFQETLLIGSFLLMSGWFIHSPAWQQGGAGEEPELKHETRAVVFPSSINEMYLY